MTTTALDIINAALKKSGVLGVGQTASAEDSNDAFDDLNDMLAQWARKRWLVYHLVDAPLTMTGATSYTVGPAGDFNVTARPDRLEAAFIRFLNSTLQPDLPLKLLQSREDYNRITLKAQTGFPLAIFYDSAYPLGSVYPWPIPTAGLYELHLTLKSVLSGFAALNTAVNLPPEYIPALKWNLCERIHASYPGLPPIPEIGGLARDALNVIREANAQIPEMRMPSGLPRRWGRYNVYTDYPNNT